MSNLLIIDYHIGYNNYISLHLFIDIYEGLIELRRDGALYLTLELFLGCCSFCHQLLVLPILLFLQHLQLPQVKLPSNPTEKTTNYTHMQMDRLLRS